MAYIPNSLLSRFNSIRRELLSQQVEECFTAEHVTERVEEREFDEQERLRVHRTIERDVARSAVMRGYRQYAVSLQVSGSSESTVRGEIEGRIEQDLRSIGPDFSPAALARYGQIIPPERWPRVLATGRQLDGLTMQLLRRGLQVDPANSLERLGVLSFACPPEESVLRGLAALDEADAFEDPNASLVRIRPTAKSDVICDHRALLRLSPDLSQTLGDGVTIAILDTGIDAEHPAFSLMRPEDYRDFTGEGLEDADGHGTHVASIAAGADPVFGGRAAGIAPRSHLLVGRVLPAAGLTPLETVLEAMAWAIFEKKADVISLSIGNHHTAINGLSVWTRVCEEAVSQGTVVCVAAGNNDDGPSPDTIVAPGDAKLVVTVGALDPEGLLAEFSARGNAEPEAPLFGKPNTVAPGVNILGARSHFADLPQAIGTNGLYTGMTGTSMAAPIVAGCIALMKSKALQLGLHVSARELIDLYYASCHALQDERGAMYCPGSEIGHGLVDMREALALIETKRHLRRAAVAVQAADPEPPELTAQPTNPTEPPAPTCAACGKQYWSKVGVFSSQQVCRTCRRPICRTCWTVLSRRDCAEHAPATPPPPVHPKADPTVVQSFQRAGPSKVHSPVTFFNGFDAKVRKYGCFRRPGDNRDLFVDEKHRFEFTRTFGKVVQYECKAKSLFAGAAIHLSAIILSEECGGDGGDPPEDLLERVASRSGLDVQPAQFHVTGIFRRVPWGDAFTSGDPSRANLRFRFAEPYDDPAQGSLWTVHPVNWELLDIISDIFDPEPHEQADRRAVKGLNSAPELRTAGGTIPVADLARRIRVHFVRVETAVAGSNGKFRIVETRGKKIVLRAEYSIGGSR